MAESRLSKITRFYVELLQLFGERLEPVDDDVNHRGIMAGRGLDVAVCDPGWSPAGDAVVSIPHVLMDHEGHRARFVFECDKRDAFGRAGALPEQDDTGDDHGCVVGQIDQPLRGCNAQLLELLAVKGDWMGAE